MHPPPPLLLLTRPPDAADAFLRALRDAGAGPVAPILSPLFGVRALGPLPDLGGVAALVFTSANGVRAYRELGGPPGLRAVAVGPATTAAAREAGLVARSAGGDADALVALLTHEAPGGRLLHLRGTHARGDVVQRLTAAGVHAAEAVIYDQPARPPTDAALEALSASRPIVAPLFSSRTAALLCEVPRNAPILVAAMSEAVAKAARPLHSRALRVAARPDQAAMVACTADLLAQARKLEAGPGRV